LSTYWLIEMQVECWGFMAC